MMVFLGHAQNNPTGALYSVRHLVRIMSGEELNTQQYMDQVAKGTYAIIGESPPEGGSCLYDMHLLLTC